MVRPQRGHELYRENRGYIGDKYHIGDNKCYIERPERRHRPHREDRERTWTIEGGQ